MVYFATLSLLLAFGVCGSIPTEDYDDIDDEDAKSIFNKWERPGFPSTKFSKDICTPRVLSGVEWILSVRRSDYGWKEETHRAVIALAVNNWRLCTPEEIRQMEMQLEVELTNELIRKDTSMHPNDIALYIHALIATKRNPHNFYGVDLVSKLAKIVEASPYGVHPFLFLAFCNAKAFTSHHLHLTEQILKNPSTKQNLVFLALSLKAYECAGSLDFQVDSTLIGDVRKHLISRQYLDGSFGNVYTTSLVVQALASAKWNNQGALDYLKTRASVDVNMVSTYLIELALNADRVHFIKDLSPDLVLGPMLGKQDKDHQFVQYTIKVGNYPDVYFTISIKVAPNATFFDVMNLSAEQDSKFNFSYYLDKGGNPAIYSISGVPNDAEKNLYWRLCLQSDVNHNRHDSNTKTIYDSPNSFIVRHDQHVIFWYRDTNCEGSS